MASPRSKRQFRQRQPRPIIWVVTGGKTERDYLRCQRHLSRWGRFEIKIKNFHNRAKLPLVEKAIDYLDSRYKPKDGDLAWVVLDRDAESGNRDRQEFLEACEMADRNNIRVAHSNDSFELWPLLHFEDVVKPMSANELRRSLNACFPGGYKKDGRIIYQQLEKLGEGVHQLACNRADKLLAKHSEMGQGFVDANPSTKIHELLKSFGG